MELTVCQASQMVQDFYMEVVAMKQLLQLAANDVSCRVYMYVYSRV